MYYLNVIFQSLKYNIVSKISLLFFFFGADKGISVVLCWREKGVSKKKTTPFEPGEHTPSIWPRWESDPGGTGERSGH